MEIEKKFVKKWKKRCELTYQQTIILDKILYNNYENKSYMKQKMNKNLYLKNIKKNILYKYIVKIKDE